jgi:transcriptional regulator with XRE-family HTH domain
LLFLRLGVKLFLDDEGGGGMNKLFLYLQNICEIKNIKQEMIAARIGVGTASVSNYFNGKQEIKFINFLYLLDYLVEDQKKKSELVFDFCKHSTKHIESDRVAIEWASNNSEFKLQELLIRKMKKNDTNKPHAEPYEILIRRNFNNIDKKEFFKATKSLHKKKFNKPETEVLMEIAYIYALWDLGVYKLEMMTFLAEMAAEKLERITSKDTQYIKRSFSIRIKEMLANLYLKGNEIEKVREIANSIFDMEDLHLYPSPIISIYRVLAESYLFTDKDQSIEYIDKSLRLLNDGSTSLNEMKRDGIQSTSDHIRIHNGMLENLFLTDQSELAHYYATVGEVEKALNVLDTIRKKGKELTAHQLYYKAKALNNKQLMERSRKAFYENNDRFYAQMPEIYL